MIRAGTGNNITPSFYFSLSMTDSMGGNDYRNNIANCNQTHYHWGDLLVQEPGTMVGPTVQGIDELIAKDPSAHWNASTQRSEQRVWQSQPARLPDSALRPNLLRLGQAQRP